MKPSLTSVLFSAAFLVLAVSSGSAQTPAPLFPNPAKDADYVGVKYLKTGKRIVVPTAYVQIMNWGKITAVTQTSALQTLAGKTNSTARSTLEVAVAIDVPVAEAIAGELYTDLVTKLRAAGWEVVTYDDVKTNPVIAALPREQVVPEIGAAQKKVNLGKTKTHYTWVAPAGMPVIDPPLTGPLWTMRALLKDTATHALLPTYVFDPVALQAESSRGVSSLNASTSTTASLMFSQARADFLSHKHAGGAIAIKAPVAIADNVGTIKPLADASPRAANALSGALGMLTGTGSISSKKNLYACELDNVLLSEKTIAAGKAFNDLVVAGLAPALVP